jgi:phosphatidylethanolamine-binding protein (PEBP) family uncharacterized protein
MCSPSQDQVICPVPKARSSVALTFSDYPVFTVTHRVVLGIQHSVNRRNCAGPARRYARWPSERSGRVRRNGSHSRHAVKRDVGKRRHPQRHFDLYLR